MKSGESRSFSKPKIRYIDALCFYGSDYLLTTHRNQKKESDQIVTLWQLEPAAKPIAHFHQVEKYNCNTLETSTDKKYVLLGMGYFDVAVRSLDSFKFKTKSLDPQKIYQEPTFICQSWSNDNFTFDQKLELMKNYSKFAQTAAPTSGPLDTHEK